MDDVLAPATSLVDRLTLAQRYASAGLAQALQQDGCTVDQWRLLRLLGTDDAASMGALAAGLAVPLATMTRLVDGLSDRALVYRRASDDDGRRVSVHLSRQGRARLVRLDALAAAHEAGLWLDPHWRELTDGLLR